MKPIAPLIKAVIVVIVFGLMAAQGYIDARDMGASQEHVSLWLQSQLKFGGILYGILLVVYITLAVLKKSFNNKKGTKKPYKVVKRENIEFDSQRSPGVRWREYREPARNTKS